MSKIETTMWRPINEKPGHPQVGLLLSSRRTWTDQYGNLCSFGNVRDFAERIEVAFFRHNEWWWAGTGHSVFRDCREGDDLPTHWMPISDLEDQADAK